MSKKFFSIISMVTLLVATGAVAAINRLPHELNTPGTQRTLILPQAADNSPVISLGTAVDPQTGKTVEGIAIIHPKKEYHHRPGHTAGPGGTSGGGCFAYLSKGARWKTVESWVVNPQNIDDLTSDFVLSNLTADITKWEDASDGSVNSILGADILGDGLATSDALVAETSAPDGVNEVYFADVSSSGAIAVTIVWGIFAGPPSGRELVEWDQIYDDVDFDWSSSGEVGKMDFENIATHEIGHSTGMGHPDDSCAEETMYRFGATGETKKRDLHIGDIAGIDGLY